MVNSFSHTGYMALILGGSSGLGLAAAQKLAAEGMGICIIHRNSRQEMPGVRTAFARIQQEGVPFAAFNMDAAHAGKRQELIGRLQEYKGRFRCLLHSIAKGSLKAMQPEAGPVLSTDDFRLTMDYMAFSFYDWTKDMAEQGLFTRDARVLAFTSEGSHRTWAHYGAISAAKASLEAIMRQIALEFAPVGIRANCIQAGITATASMKQIPGSAALEAFSRSRNPFKRSTAPEDVADVVYLLCTDEAAWINGSIIPVDGGAHIT